MLRGKEEEEEGIFMSRQELAEQVFSRNISSDIDMCHGTEE